MRHQLSFSNSSLVMTLCCFWWTKQTGKYVLHLVSTFLQHYSMYRYASERIATLEQQGQIRPRSRFRRWKPVTLSEMKGFISAILNMGIIQVYSYTVVVNGYIHTVCTLQLCSLYAGTSYWKTSWTSRIPFFGSLMPRDCFQEIFGSSMSLTLIQLLHKGRLIRSVCS